MIGGQAMDRILQAVQLRRNTKHADDLHYCLSNQ